MTPEHSARELLLPLYRAGLEVDGWQIFVQALSTELGGAAIAVTTEDDDWEAPHESYWTGLDPQLAALYNKHVARGLPWGECSDPIFLQRFVQTSERVPPEQLADTLFYREWMQPQGLACEAPLALRLNYSNRSGGWMTFIYRMEGARPFVEDDLALCNLLAPHLATCTNLYDGIDRVHRERVALTEVVDRFLSGIFLVDEKGELLLSNVGARRILETNDGIALRDGLLSVGDTEENDELKRFLADAIGWRGQDSFGAGGEMSVDRPSGKRPYVATIVPMNPADPQSVLGNQVAVVVVADLEADQSLAADRVRRSCDLTESETELVRLMAEGFSLETISRERGVTINTTRTHLRHVFSKTNTNSQSEVVRLVLSPSASMAEVG